MSDSIIISLIIELEDHLNEALNQTTQNINDFAKKAGDKFSGFSEQVSSKYSKLRATIASFSDHVGQKLHDMAANVGGSTEEMSHHAGFLEQEMNKNAKAILDNYEFIEKIFVAEKLINFLQHTDLFNKSLLNIGTAALHTKVNLVTLEGAVNDLIDTVGGKLKAAFEQVKETFEMAEGAVNLEFTLTQIQTVTRASSHEMELLEQKALDLNRETAYTAVQAAEGMNTLAHSGYSAEESLQVVGDVLNFAYGNTIDMAEAAGYLTSALSIFGLEKDNASRVVDVLSKGAALANTNVSELGLALTYSGKQASSMGYSIEKTVSMLDLLADGGLRGEKAGTALRSMLVSLANPASKAREALARLGDSSGDFDSSMQTIAKAMASTDERIQNLGQTAILSFDVSAGAALHSFVDMAVKGLADSSGALEKYESQLATSSGFAQQSTDMLMNTTKGWFTQLDSAWHGLLHTLEKPLLQPIISGAQIFTVVFNSVASVIEAVTHTFPGLTQVLANLFTPILVFSTFLKILVGLIMVFSRLLIGQAIWSLKGYALAMINAMNSAGGATINQKIYNAYVTAGNFILQKFVATVRMLTISLIAGFLPMIVVIELFNYIQSSAGLASAGFKALVITVLILTASMRAQLTTAIASILTWIITVGGAQIALSGYLIVKEALVYTIDLFTFSQNKATAATAVNATATKAGTLSTVVYGVASKTAAFYSAAFGSVLGVVSGNLAKETVAKAANTATTTANAAARMAGTAGLNAESVAQAKNTASSLFNTVAEKANHAAKATGAFITTAYADASASKTVAQLRETASTLAQNTVEKTSQTIKATSAVVTSAYADASASKTTAQLRETASTLAQNAVEKTSQAVKATSVAVEESQVAVKAQNTALTLKDTLFTTANTAATGASNTAKELNAALNALSATALQGKTAAEIKEIAANAANTAMTAANTLAVEAQAVANRMAAQTTVASTLTEIESAAVKKMSAVTTAAQTVATRAQNAAIAVSTALTQGKTAEQIREVIATKSSSIATAMDTMQTRVNNASKVLSTQVISIESAAKLENAAANTANSVATAANTAATAASVTATAASATATGFLATSLRLVTTAFSGLFRVVGMLLSPAIYGAIILFGAAWFGLEEITKRNTEAMKKYAQSMESVKKSTKFREDAKLDIENIHNMNASQLKQLQTNLREERQALENASVELRAATDGLQLFGNSDWLKIGGSGWDWDSLGLGWLMGHGIDMNTEEVNAQLKSIEDESNKLGQALLETNTQLKAAGEPVHIELLSIIKDGTEDVVKFYETLRAAVGTDFDTQLASVNDQLKQTVDLLGKEKNEDAVAKNQQKLIAATAQAAQQIIGLENARMAQSINIAERIYQAKADEIKKNVKDEEGRQMTSDEQAKKMRDAAQELAKARVDAAKQAYDATKAQLDKSTQDYINYVGVVKQLEKSIEDERKKQATTIRDLTRAQLTDSKQFATEKQQLAQMSGGVEAAAMQGNYQLAETLAKKREQLAKSLESREKLSVAQSAQTDRVKESSELETTYKKAMEDKNFKLAEETARKRETLIKEIADKEKQYNNDVLARRQEISSQQIALAKEVADKERDVKDKQSGVAKAQFEGKDSAEIAKLSQELATAQAELTGLIDLKTQFNNLSTQETGKDGLASSESVLLKENLNIVEQTKSAHDAINEAMAAQKAEAEANTAAQKQQVDSLTQALQVVGSNLDVLKQNEINVHIKVNEMELDKQFDEINKKFSGKPIEQDIKAVAFVDQANLAIDSVKDKLTEIKDKTVTVTVKTLESHFGGGMVGIAKFFHGGLLKFAAGGKLPGFSSYDNIMGRITGTGQPVALAGGEMVVNNKRTKMFSDLLNFVNFGSESAVSKFKTSLSNFRGYFEGGFILPQVAVLSYNSGGNVPVGGAANFVQNIVNQSNAKAMTPVTINVGQSSVKFSTDNPGAVEQLIRALSEQGRGG